MTCAPDYRFRRGNITFYDGQTTLQPNRFEGSAFVKTIGLGAILVANWGEMRLGSNQSDPTSGIPTPGIGAAASVAILFTGTSKLSSPPIYGCC